METRDEHDQPHSDPVKIRVMKGFRLFALTNALSNTVLARQVDTYELQTGPDGRFHLGIDFNRQLAVEVEFYHPASDIRIRLTLVFH